MKNLPILHQLARKGNTIEIIKLLKDGAKVNELSSEKLTPLMAAASVGALSCAQALVDRGARGDAMDTLNNTALHYAGSSRNGRRVFQLLLDHGAKINAENAFKRTPLHRSAASGLVKNVNKLLVLGANPRAKDATGNTALHCAVQSGHADSHAICSILMDADPTCVHAKDDWGHTALYQLVAAYMDLELKITLFSLFISHEASIKTTGKSDNLFWCALQAGQFAFAQYLLDTNQFAIDQVDEEGVTFLQYAILELSDDQDVALSWKRVQFLLQNRCAVNTYDHSGLNPLCYAVVNNWHELITLLLTKDAHFSFEEDLKHAKRHPHFVSVFWSAVITKDNASVQLLLDHAYSNYLGQRRFFCSHTMTKDEYLAHFSKQFQKAYEQRTQIDDSSKEDVMYIPARP